MIPFTFASAPNILRTHVWALLLCICGIGLLFLSAALMLAHAQVFQGMRETLPLAARIPALEARVAILSEQVELSELHAAMSTRSAEEKVRLYILPKEVDLPRVLGYMELLRDHLKKDRTLTTISGINVGEELSLSLPNDVTLSAVPFSFSASVHDQGLRDLLDALDFTGISTVSDALTKEQYEELFRATEAENPAGILALERFLSTDFLMYAKDRRATEETLLKSFSSEAFRGTLEKIKEASLLSKGVAILESDFGAALKKNRLWPLPLLTVEEIDWKETEDGLHEVTLEIFAYSRE